MLCMLGFSYSLLAFSQTAPAVETGVWHARTPGIISGSLVTWAPGGQATSGTVLTGCGKTLVRGHGSVPLLAGNSQLFPANDVRQHRRCKRRALLLRFRSHPPDADPSQASCTGASCYPASSCRRNDPDLL